MRVLSDIFWKPFMLLCCYCTTNAALECINQALEGVTGALNIGV